jgi:hypothetical protein
VILSYNLSKSLSRYDLQNFRKRKVLGDDQSELSKGTVDLIRPDGQPRLNLLKNEHVCTVTKSRPRFGATADGRSSIGWRSLAGRGRPSKQAVHRTSLRKDEVYSCRPRRWARWAWARPEEDLVQRSLRKSSRSTVKVYIYSQRRARFSRQSV